MTNSKLLAKPSFGLGFQTPEAKLVIIKLRQVFIKILIFYHFHSESYIWVKNDVSNYTINELLNQLIFNN